MAERSMLITDKALAKLPFASAGQYRVNDTELKGFVVVIGRRTKTFAAQASFWRNGMREFATRKKIGEAGDMTSRDARSKAKEILAKIARGERPDDESSIKRGALSLRTAWERYREGHMVRKGRSAGTIENYRDHMDRLFADWLDKPLARLGRQPNLVVERHEKITREHGAYIANGAMRSLRAVYNHACKSHLDLPRANPVIAVDWNKEHRRETGMGAGPLAAWFAELSGLSNIVRREFHLLTLLSGSRPTALKHVRPEHVDFRRRVLHIPKPKGGEERAFDIPLSRPMIRCIIRALRIGRVAYPNQAESWLFPADSTSGHLVEHKEDRRDLSKWGNELRQTYRTLAQSAGVSQLDVHLLMNHSLPGVNAGYITRDGLLGDHLRKQQERISKIIIDAASGSDDGADTTWFRCSKLEFVISKPAFARAA